MAATHGFSMGTVAGTAIPVEHLDYGYIKKCKNARELEKIVQVLRRVALVALGQGIACSLRAPSSRARQVGEGGLLPPAGAVCGEVLGGVGPGQVRCGSA